ncbi:TonB-dependent siderophore receptor [Halopseudomonas sabulinigri]|uniref:TonB-dependent siderophore receptor n=1 Tax=Halopseudomonas sabulinigri TaxID=472181 RepID=A0ABP9ZL68_9GAMM
MTHAFSRQRVAGAHFARLPLRAAIIAVSLLTSVAQVQAQVQTQPGGVDAQRNSYQIAAGTLANALTDFAAQAGVTVQFKPSLTEGRQSPGLRGEYSVTEGFARLLQGSGLSIEQHGSRVYVLSAAGTDAALLAPLTITGQHAVHSPSAAAGSVVATTSAAGTKTGTPLIRTPQAVNVVTREELQQHGANNVSQALQYTPGLVSQYGNADVRHDWFTVRGFTPGRYLDGLRLPFGVLGYAQPKIASYGLERVEVFKGPASVLYGQNAPGGMINMVSKRPSVAPVREVYAEYGSYDAQQVGFDLGGALTDSGNLLYRLVGQLGESDSRVDYLNEERQFIAPSLTWLIGDDTQLTLLAQYQNIDSDGGGAQPALPASGTLYGGSAYGKLDADTFIGEPGFDRFSNEQMMAGWEFEHQLNEVWQLRQNLRASRVDTYTQRVQAYSMISPTVLARYAWAFPEDSTTFTVDNQAIARFATGSAEHTLLIGADYQHEDATYDEHFQGTSVSPIDLSTLEYSGDAVKPPLTTRREQDRYQAGLYLQEELQLAGWTFNLGGRYDLAKADSKTTDVLAGTSSTVDQDDEAFTGRFGLVYEFANGIAPYASYSQSFAPTAGVGTDGNALKPTEGEQYELGVRYQPASGSSLWTLSVYDLTQQNVLTRDLLTNVRSQTGEVRVRGMELEGKMALRRGLDASVSYALTDSEITRDGNPTVEGNEQPFVPNKQGSAWLNYVVQSSALRGLGLGGGVRYIGKSYGEVANNFESPSVTLFDAVLSYDVGALSQSLEGAQLSLSANNIMDKEYVSYCISSTGCFYDGGRVVTAQVKYNW